MVPKCDEMRNQFRCLVTRNLVRCLHVLPWIRIRSQNEGALRRQDALPRAEKTGISQHSRTVSNVLKQTKFSHHGSDALRF